MKKKLYLVLFLGIEFLLLGYFCLGSIFLQLSEISFLKYFYIAGEWLFSLFKTIGNGLGIDNLCNAMFKSTMPNVVGIISIFFMNILFIITYYIIFGILTIVFDKQREKKIRPIVSPYTLTTNEYDKFNYRYYLQRFPLKRTVSLIIPVLFILTFIFLRFDEVICFETNSIITGNTRFYTYTLEPFFNRLFAPNSFHAWMISLMHTSEGHGYIDLANNLLGNAPWIEYILLVIFSAIILSAWYGLFTLIYLIYKKPYARYKANRDRKAYIKKMELIEYRLHNKYKDETNIKADDFMHIVETEQQAAAKEIARFKMDLDSEESINIKQSEERKKAYYEEIGEGVTDLGVSNETIDLDKPIVEREIKYISDEEVDIILDEEPVIEVVEDELEETEDFRKNDIFFEKYQPNDIELRTLEEYSGEEFVKEKINSDEIKEEPLVKDSVNQENILDEEHNKESLEVVEKIEELVSKEDNNVQEASNEVIEDKVEEVVEEVNEPIQEAKEVANEEKESIDVEESSLDNNEEAKEETTNGSTFNETEEKKVKTQEIAESIEKGIKEGINVVKDKVNAFAKYIGRKNKPGYGAKKVPSFKEIEEEKETK